MSRSGPVLLGLRSGELIFFLDRLCATLLSFCRVEKISWDHESRNRPDCVNSLERRDGDLRWQRVNVVAGLVRHDQHARDLDRRILLGA